MTLRSEAGWADPAVSAKFGQKAEWYKMKCSKCGGEIKNLPEYIEEIGAEVLCSACAGTAERSDESMVYDGFRYFRGFVESSDELEIAA